MIGELAVCQFESKEVTLDCKCKPKTKDKWLWDPGENYDAKNESDNIQIKTRRLQTSTNLLGGRMGRFGSAKTINEKDESDKYNFKRGILAVLDYNFKIAEIWEWEVWKIQTLEQDAKKRKQESNGKDKKLLGLNISTFINKNNNPKRPIVKQYIHDNYDCFFETLKKTSL